MSLNKVFVTGAGAVSPYGLGVAAMMDKLYQGCSAVVNLKSEWEKEIEDLNSWIGAPVTVNLDEKAIPRKYRKTMGKTAVMAYLASLEALGQSGIAPEQLSSGRVGISFSSTTGSARSTLAYYREIINAKAIRNLSSGIFLQVMSHTCAANLATCFGVRGRVLSPNSACSSSSQAIGLAYESIKNGIQDVMLCGGSDELTAVVTSSFELVQAASIRYNDHPAASPRPFDAHRDGTVCGEGAGALVLESERSARERNATVLGEVIGFYTCSSGMHLTQTDVNSAVFCMRHALADAGVQPEDIDYINAHATGTVMGDADEAEALYQVFGTSPVPVSSLKGHFGHTLGASGVLEMIATLGMMKRGRIIPTLNLHEIAAKCALINHVRTVQDKALQTAIKNSFAFGGINSVLIVRKQDDD